MPGTSDSSESDDILSQILTEKNDFHDSDSEEHSTASRDDPAVAKDYWFGKKYFECVLAHALIFRTRTQVSIPAIESKLTHTILNYPFARAWTYLRTEGVSGPWPSPPKSRKDSPEAFFFLSGAILRSGNAVERKALSSAIRKFINEKEVESSPQASVSGSEKTHKEAPNFRDSIGSQEKLAGTAKIAQFTSALKEYGDKIGFVPKYSSEPATMEPIFKETVRFNERTFEGQSRTRKLAKHEASKAACEYFGVKV